jgi:hypothetical protein
MAFLFAMLIPPSDYLKKTGIRIKLTPLAITHAVAGLTSAILVHRKIDPTFIERGLRIT